ncbi:MAG: hypothetical protein DWQ02_15160 [Bacteroidetes bacterium]|nr:MAG: hypothetical protein DWQ02_15160 [Bacteroidota bacterium]
MNKTITILFRIIFLSFLAFQIPAQAQNITLDYTPPESICSFDTLGCTGSVSIPFSLTAENNEGIIVSHQISLDGEMPVDDVYGSLSGVYPGYIIFGNYPIGQHSFVVTVVQGGDSLVTDIEFSVVDCVAPEAEIQWGMSYLLSYQPDGCCRSTGNALDFVVNQEVDCSEPLNFAILKEDDFLSGVFPLVDSLEVIVFDCNDEETIFVRIFYWDNAFNPYALQSDGTLGGANYDSFLSYVYLQQPNGSGCGGLPSNLNIGGEIHTEEQEGIDGVQVDLLVDIAEDISVLTDQDGEFIFSNLIAGADCEIIPMLDLNHTNGVSTFDAILIQKHILGIQPLDSPYKMIAADVNNSGSISISDVIQLRKLILGNLEALPDNSSWRFIDASYVFPNPSSPWVVPFPEEIKINNISEDEFHLNFIGIKIGDVNGSAIVSLD